MLYANIRLVTVNNNSISEFEGITIQQSGSWAVEDLKNALNEGYEIIKVVVTGRDNDTMVFVMGQTKASKELYEN